MLPASILGWDLAYADEILLSGKSVWLPMQSVATVLGSIPASVGTVESEGRPMKQCWIKYEKKKKIPPKNIKIKILGGTDCGGTRRGLHRVPSALAGHDAHRVRGPRALPGHLLLPLPRLLHVGGWRAPGRGRLHLDHRQDTGRVRIKICLSSWNFHGNF